MGAGLQPSTQGDQITVEPYKSELASRHPAQKEGPDGTTVEVATGAPYSIKTASCVAIGAHVGHNTLATEAARADVMGFLTTTLLK